MRSSFCTIGDCVEVEFANGRVYVCSDDNVVSFTLEEWAAFILGAKAGEFDVPDGDT